MSLIEKILCKLFHHVDIIRYSTGDIYLRRWFIYPRNKDLGKSKLKRRFYLHKFYRGDEDFHVHSHPWPFISFILTGGYYEETPHLLEQENLLSKIELEISTWYSYPGEWRRRIFYPRFSIIKRPATWQHRVILKNKKPIWTFVITGVKERGWGFWINGKMCPSRWYNNGECLVETIDKSKVM